MEVDENYLQLLIDNDPDTKIKIDKDRPKIHKLIKVIEEKLNIIFHGFECTIKCSIGYNFCSNRIPGMAILSFIITSNNFTPELVGKFDKKLLRLGNKAFEFDSTYSYFDDNRNQLCVYFSKILG